MRHKSTIPPGEILIRPVTAADAAALLSIYAPYVRKTAVTFEYEVPTEEEFRRRIERTLKRFPYLAAYRRLSAGAENRGTADTDGRLAAGAEKQSAPGTETSCSAAGNPDADQEELLGYAYAGYFKERAAYDWACEVSIYVREDRKRDGIGRRLYEALELCLAAMGMRNLYACIGIPEEDDEYLNHDSVRFHERMGYRLCGTFRRCGYKFGRWYDMCWMEKFLQGDPAGKTASAAGPGTEEMPSSGNVPEKLSPVVPFPEMVRKAAGCGAENENPALPADASGQREKERKLIHGYDAV